MVGPWKTTSASLASRQGRATARWRAPYAPVSVPSFEAAGVDEERNRVGEQPLRAGG